MNYWWVNQNQTYKAEVGGGFLWSPKTRSDGARNQFYDNMLGVNPGDIVFSFCDTRIKAVGVATKRAVSSPKPDFGSAGSDFWNPALTPILMREAALGLERKSAHATFRWPRISSAHIRTKRCKGQVCCRN